MSTCLACGKPTINPKFCCRSCATSYNNKFYKKRKKKQRYCLVCGEKVTNRKRYCDEHNKQFVDWSKITYSEAIGKRNYQRNSRIRTLARKDYLKSNLPKKCAICGYDKYFHVCHKKPISDHKEGTFVSEINRLDNLVALCPNHHWEFDNKLLSVDFPEFDYLHS
jgi:predicted HNH restriction endonuclease